jgi:hypothetical protein
MEMFVSLVFVAVLVGIAVFTARLPLRNLKRLCQPELIPSDERRYLGRQARLRLINSAFMLVLAGLLANAYLGGVEKQAGLLTQRIDAKQAGTLEISAEERETDREFFRYYSYYWIAVLSVLFIILAIAVADLMTTRSYAWGQLTRIRKENRDLLERDLAMYRQQKLNDRAKRMKQ